MIIQQANTYPFDAEAFVQTLRDYEAVGRSYPGADLHGQVKNSRKNY